MRFITALLGAVVTAALHAAPPPPEVFFGDPDLVEAVLSPSGRKLALTTKAGSPRLALVVLDLAPGGKPVRTALFNDGDVFNVHWVNDGRLLFSVQDDAGVGKRPTGAPGLMAVNADGSRMTPLISRTVASGDGSPGLNDRLLSWRHRLLKVPAPRPGEANEEVLVGRWEPGSRAAVTPLWLNTRTQVARPVKLGDAPGDAVGWLTDSRGEPRVALTREGLKQGAWWRDPRSGAWRQLFEHEGLSAPFDAHSVDDSGEVYVTRLDGPQGERVLARFDVEKGAPESQALVRTPGFDFLGSLLTEPGRAGPLGVRVEIDRETTVWYDAAMKALQDEADRLLPDRVNRIQCRRCGQPDMTALVRSYSDRDPGRLWLFQAQPPAGEKRWRGVGAVRANVDPAQMGRVQFERIRARDGLDLPLWITTPAGAEAGKALPTVVLVHGGPWVRGGRWQWDDTAQFLASRGYLVIEPEFRGSSGYGEAHLKASYQQWGRAMQDDVADALLWARQQGLASERACIAGASYGGYSTLMGLARHPQLYRCGLAWVAVTDLALYLQGNWWVQDDLGRLGRNRVLPEMVYDSKTQAALIEAHSPVHLADRIQAPLLLAFGGEDLRVPLAHGERMREALRKAGREPEWVVYPNEGHGWWHKENRYDFAARMERFLAQHLKEQK
jgi:acetyl esterase/lipase